MLRLEDFMEICMVRRLIASTISGGKSGLLLCIRLLSEASNLLRAMNPRPPLLITEAVSTEDPISMKVQGGLEGPVQPSANLLANLVRTRRSSRRKGKWESQRDFHLFLTCWLLHNMSGLWSEPPRLSATSRSPVSRESRSKSLPPARRSGQNPRQS